MSKIYFHNMHREVVEVSGSERYYAGRLCSDLLLASLSINADRLPTDPLLLKCVDKRSAREVLAQHSLIDMYNTFTLFLRTGSMSFHYDDRELSSDTTAFDASLNTALAIGSDPVKLIARLHGQCELHTYVEEHNRAWLARIIQQGIGMGVLRGGMGWNFVEALLWQTEVFPGPVVASFSGTSSFPDVEMVELGAGEQEAAFYELPEPEQWRLCMGTLRTDPSLELKPENWHDFRFTNGITGFDLRASVETNGRR